MWIEEKSGNLINLASYDYIWIHHSTSIDLDYDGYPTGKTNDYGYQVRATFVGGSDEKLYSEMECRILFSHKRESVCEAVRNQIRFAIQSGAHIVEYSRIMQVAMECPDWTKGEDDATESDAP